MNTTADEIMLLKQRLAKIRGNDPVSRSRRASIKARILELEAQAAEEEEA